MARHDETPAVGSVRLDCGGYLADTLRNLYTLRFRVTGAPHAPVATTIHLGGNLTVGARCLESLTADDPTVIIDGGCVGLVRRRLLEVALAAWPNPARDAVDVAVSLPAESHATLKVVSVLGREVALLADGVLPAGRSSFRFDARALPAGEYRLVLLAGGAVCARPLQMVK
jgi:hypothetical protein